VSPTRRERRNRLLKVAAGAVAIVLVAGWLFLRWTDKDAPAESLPVTPPGPSATADPPAKKARSAPADASQVKLPGGFGVTDLAGLQGGSRSINIGKHRVVLHAWSAKPMAWAAWYVPTRTGAKRGLARLPGRSWTMTTTAYGKPDYAQLYLQTTVTGEPVHCSITVDGKVTAKEVTEGPFGTIMCQG
jgi:hypothetical protein